MSTQVIASSPPIITYPEQLRIRAALEESDRLDALMNAYHDNEPPAMSIKEAELLGVQQAAAWSLVRGLVFDAMDTDKFDPPLCCDLGDVVIIIYGHQDFHSDPHREMGAGFTASRRIARPESAPAWANKGKSEPEEEDADDEDDGDEAAA